MRYSKKVISALLCVIMILSFAACRSDENDPFKKAKTKQHITTTQAEDSSPSSLTYFNWNGNKVTGVTDKGKKKDSLTVPKECSSFSPNIFSGSSVKAKSVTFTGKSVDLNNGFTGDKNIEKVILPSEQKVIKENDFAGCTNLTTIEIPSKTKIEPGAFTGDTKLENIIIIGETDEQVDPSLFEDCPGKDNIQYIDEPTTKTNLTTKNDNVNVTIDITTSTDKEKTVLPRDDNFQTNNHSTTTTKANHSNDNVPTTQKTTTTKPTITKKDVTTNSSQEKPVTTKPSVNPPQQVNSAYKNILKALQDIDSGQDMNKKIAEYIKQDDSSDALKRIKY